MSREIKFRGKVKWNGNHLFSGDWIEGNFIQLILGGNIHRYIQPLDEKRVEIEWDTLGQYTGLKDKNGKEIYEGDIVHVIALGNDHNQRGAWEDMEIKYFMGNACLFFKGYETGTPIYPHNVNHSIEIIGNIHDNN